MYSVVSPCLYTTLTAVHLWKNGTGGGAAPPCIPFLPGMHRPADATGGLYVGRSCPDLRGLGAFSRQQAAQGIPGHYLLLPAGPIKGVERRLDWWYTWVESIRQIRVVGGCIDG